MKVYICAKFYGNLSNHYKIRILKLQKHIHNFKIEKKKNERSISQQIMTIFVVLLKAERVLISN